MYFLPFGLTDRLLLVAPAIVEPKPPLPNATGAAVPAGKPPPPLLASAPKGAARGYQILRPENKKCHVPPAPSAGAQAHVRTESLLARSSLVTVSARRDRPPPGPVSPGVSALKAKTRKHCGTRCVCLLLQYLLPSCSRGGGRAHGCQI